MKKHKRLRRTIRFFVLSFAYLLFLQLFYNMLKFDEPFPEGNVYEVLLSLAVNYIPVLLSIIVNQAIVFGDYLKGIRRKYLPAKIGLDLALSIIAWVAIDNIFLVAARLINQNVTIDHVGTLLSAILVFLMIETMYYIKSSTLSMKRAEMARHKAMKYQYDALKAQINPHFLFNSLNILYSLVSIDADKSKRFILSLSNIYRYIASYQRSVCISLAEEMEFLKSYVDILEIRYHNQFMVNIREDSPMNGKFLIPYTLQLMLENVTKHNIISTRCPMTVDICIGEHYLRVSNPIMPKDSPSNNEAEAARGIGLRNISEQYALHGKKITVQNDGKTFTVMIPYINHNDITLLK